MNVSAEAEMRVVRRTIQSIRNKLVRRERAMQDLHVEIMGLQHDLSVAMRRVRQLQGNPNASA